MNITSEQIDTIYNNSGQDSARLAAALDALVIDAWRAAGVVRPVVRARIWRAINRVVVFSSDQGDEFLLLIRGAWTLVDDIGDPEDHEGCRVTDDGHWCVIGETGRGNEDLGGRISYVVNEEIRSCARKAQGV